MSEIIKVENLTHQMSGIYKLNYPDGKIYIGKANDLKRRMWEHNSSIHSSCPEKLQKCDEAIWRLGAFTEIEILEFIEPNEEELNKAERKWELIFNPRNPLVGYNVAPCGFGGGFHGILTDEQVLDIRKRRFEGKRKKDVFKDYQEICSMGCFEKVWLGQTYQWIGSEYLIPTNSISRQEYSSKANSGSNNGRSKMTNQDVKNIRNRYDNGEKICEIHKSYPLVSRNTISRICKRQSYTNVI